MSVFFPDILGSPSGSQVIQNLRNIVCLAPQAANQLSVTRNDIAYVGPGATGVYNRWVHKYHIPYVPTTTGTLWHS